VGDIGPERAHYDVLPTAEDVPAPAVEVDVESQVRRAEEPDLEAVPGS
jgi:hypothetical protein